MNGGLCGSSGAHGSGVDGVHLSLTPLQASYQVPSCHFSTLSSVWSAYIGKSRPLRWAMYQGDRSAAGTDKLGPQVKPNGKGGHPRKGNGVMVFLSWGW